MRQQAVTNPLVHTPTLKLPTSYQGPWSYQAKQPYLIGYVGIPRAKHQTPFHCLSNVKCHDGIGTDVSEGGGGRKKRGNAATTLETLPPPTRARGDKQEQNVSTRVTKIGRGPSESHHLPEQIERSVVERATRTTCPTKKRRELCSSARVRRHRGGTKKRNKDFEMGFRSLSGVSRSLE